MKKIFLCVIVCFFTSISFAQTNDPAYTAAIKKMMIVSGNENSHKVVINQMIDMMKQQKPNAPQDFWDKMKAEFLKTSITELVEMMVPVYQKHLTLADVNQMIEFYESPVGKKFAEKTPLIMQESMKVGQQWGIKLGQQMAEKLKN